MFSSPHELKRRVTACPAARKAKRRLGKIRKRRIQHSKQQTRNEQNNTTMGLEVSADLQMSVDLESKRDFLTKRTLDELITISSNMGLDHEQLLRGVAKKKKTKTLVNSIIEKLEKNPNDFYCDVCGVVSTDKCSKCSSAFYCSAEHQLQDWPTHKLVCKLIRSNTDIRDAVNMWCSDPTRALKKYGHISEWNTSRVTNMMLLFNKKRSLMMISVNGMLAKLLP